MMGADKVRSYNKNFKEQIIKECIEADNCSAIAKKYGVPATTVYEWVRKAKNTRKNRKEKEAEDKDEKLTALISASIAKGLEEANSNNKSWATVISIIVAMIGVIGGLAGVIWQGHTQKELMKDQAENQISIWQKDNQKERDLRALAESAALFNDILEENSNEIRAAKITALSAYKENALPYLFALRQHFQDYKQNSDVTRILDVTISSIFIQNKVQNKYDFRNFTFPRVNDNGQVIAGSIFQYKDLVQSDFQDADFRACDLKGADFSDSILKKARFEGADLSSVIFTRADLQGVIFGKLKNTKKVTKMTDLNAADFTNAEFDDKVVGFYESKNLSKALFSLAVLMEQYEIYDKGKNKSSLFYKVKDKVLEDLVLNHKKRFQEKIINDPEFKKILKKAKINKLLKIN
jgi:uncharacterized protein YjbI with pentapeptide repeats/transposase-like protein